VKIAPILAETASCRLQGNFWREGSTPHHHQASPSKPLLPSTLLQRLPIDDVFLIAQLLIPMLLLRRPQIPLLTHTKIILARVDKILGAEGWISSH